MSSMTLLAIATLLFTLLMAFSVSLKIAPRYTRVIVNVTFTATHYYYRIFRSILMHAALKKLSGPGKGASIASKTTDGPCVSQLGDRTTRKDNKSSQTSERRPGRIMARHDLAEDNAITIDMQGNMEVVR